METYVGIAPRDIVRVALCVNPECSDRGAPVLVPDSQLTYICTCGQEIRTFKMSKKIHAQFAEEYKQDRENAIDSFARWCYAPQLHLNKEDGEPYSG